MDAYFEAKAMFGDHLLHQKTKRRPVFVINLDDPYGKRLAERFDGKNIKVLTYGGGFGADYRFTDLQNTIQGTQFTMEHKGRSFLVRIPLLGRFNVYNCLAAIAAIHGMGYNLRETVANMANIPQVPGRMQSVGRQRNFKVLVDYAHTPDAMENALKTVKELGPRRIVTVFGCGGSRDKTKRPLMAAAAESFSNVLILTSDNPRQEDPESIIRDIASGLSGTVPCVAITDRDEAIRHAIESARDGDVILIAGKGHETQQVFADRTIEFDDVRVASRHLKNRLRSEVSE
jgi:UDP-N-acetylmuramoyl-L-alanyl-D-glutamate--2,6-diaminopimelate ligase